MKQIGRLLGVALLAMGLVRLTAVLWSRSGAFVADTWRNELDRAADDGVDAILARIATLGDEAVPVLADALGSSRDAVAQAAKRTLWAEIGTWDAAAGHDLGARYHRLAAALAERTGRYGSTARLDAAAMANHFLSRPLPDAGGRGKLLAACTEVLRGQVGIDASSLPDAGEAPSSSAPPPASVPGGDSGTASLGAPGALGGQPLETSPGAEATGPVPRTADAKNRGGSDEPRLLQENPPDASVGPPRRPGRLSSRAENPVRSGGDSHRPTTNEPRSLDPVRRLKYEEAGRSGKGSADGSKGTVDVRTVAGRLHDEDPVEVESARKELKRRGFTESELDLAGQLTDSDPAVRRKLARTILSTPGVDAGPWLLELCGDSDADVRFEAVTLLATTGDPALIEQVRRRAQVDPDERIQRLAERLGRPANSREKRK